MLTVAISLSYLDVLIIYLFFWKGLRQTSITRKIPATKRSMERFLFCVKALLHTTPSRLTFWMGMFCIDSFLVRTSVYRVTIKSYSKLDHHFE